MRTRHARKIEVAVVDHVPRQMTWHVIECRCGWSSALHTSRDDALRAYNRHRARDRKKAA